MDIWKFIGDAVYTALKVMVFIIFVALVYSIIHIGDDPFAEEDMQGYRNDIDSDLYGGVVLDLGGKVLMVSDLPGGNLTVVRDGAKCHLILSDGNATRIYNSIREEQGVIVCRSASDEYLLDKQGNEIGAPSSPFTEREIKHLDEQINILEDRKDLTEEKRAVRVDILEERKRLVKENPGFSHISVERNMVFDHYGSQTVFVGSLL